MDVNVLKYFYNTIRILFLLLSISISVTLHASIISYDHLVPVLSNNSNSKENKDQITSQNIEESLILTPYIEKNQIREAKHRALVYDKQLLNVLSYSGYFAVDKKHDSNMWFWHVPVEDGDVENKPLLVWFQGGPGDTSMYGMFKELGPFRMDKTKTFLQENPYSWHRDHSLLFIDNPVGVGFSFTRDDEGLSTTLVQVTKNLYEALSQFFVMFPELRNSPLYLAGESYAGKYIPYLATEIHERNPAADVKINLQGMAIGNGFIDPPSLIKTSSIALSYDFINDNTAAILNHEEDLVIDYFERGDFLNGISAWEVYLSKFWEATNLPNIYNYVDDYFEDVYSDDGWVHFITGPEIRKKLHVGKVEWDLKKDAVRYALRSELHTSAKHLLENLLNKNYKVMLYSGNLDMMVPYKLSINSYKSMNWKGRDEYLSATRKPWNFNGTLAGYITRASNFIEVMIRNAGHMVPADQPQIAQALMLAFTRGLVYNETAFDSDYNTLYKKGPIKSMIFNTKTTDDDDDIVDGLVYKNTNIGVTLFPDSLENNCEPSAFSVLPPNPAGRPWKSHECYSLQLSLLLIIGLAGKTNINFL